MTETLKTYKNWFIETPINWLNNNPDIKAVLILIVGVLIIVFGIYTFLDFLKALNDKKKPIFSINIRFPIPSDTEQEERAILNMNNFFSSCHDLLKEERLSLEIHKVSDYLDLVLTTTNQQDLENIKKFLTNIERLAISETQTDYLDNYLNEKEAPQSFFNKNNRGDKIANSNLSIRHLILAKNLNPINLEQTQTFTQICDYLTSLNSEIEKGGVVFILRPVTDKTDRINKLIKSNNYQKEDKKALSSQKDNENRGLVMKSQNKIFLANIYTIGTNNQISKALASTIKGIDGDNKFTTRKAMFPKLLLKRVLKKRYITNENLFVKFFRSFYGSYLNTQEIALLFHPSKIKRGSYGTNKSVVIEASPEFFKESENSTLVGSSYLKTGEKQKIFIPNQSRRRHTYALGSTGSGKSTTLINTALSVIKDKKSALIFFDPNGMDIKNIMRRLSPEELKERVIYLDPSYSANTPTINPFIKGFRATRTEKDSLTENILNIFEQGAKDGDLGTSIKKLLKVLISTGVYFPDYYYKTLINQGLSEQEAEKRVFDKQLTLADIPYILNKNYSFREFLITVFSDGNDNISLIWQKQIDQFNTNPSILDGIDNRLANITTDSILPILEGSKFDISRLVKEKKIILIPNTEPLFGVKGKKLLPQMIITELWATVQREQNLEDIEKAVIIIDEVEEVQLPIIPTMLSQARKYGLSLVLANQYLFQLQDWFTKAILGNVANLFIFKMRNKDEVKYITPMFGGHVNDMDITGLEKFQGYLTTLNDQNAKASNIMSFETIDYHGNYPELSTDKDIQELATTCLEKYGENREELETRRKEKLEDPTLYFLGD